MLKSFVGKDGQFDKQLTENIFNLKYMYKKREKNADTFKISKQSLASLWIRPVFATL